MMTIGTQAKAAANGDVAGHALAVEDDVADEIDDRDQLRSR